MVSSKILRNDGAKDIGRLKTLFNEVPFAYVEAKKLAGGKKCDDAILTQALKKDGRLLAREIDILRPNIIVCCDTHGIIFDSVVRNYDFNCRLYYYKEKGALLFNSFHPSSRVNKWKISEAVYSPFRQFFARYKTFDAVSKPIHR